MSGLGLAWRRRSADGRPKSELERDIRDELEGHLALAAAELERQGLSPQDARAEAEKRFGDLAAVVAEVERVHLMQRLVLHWPMLAALALAVLSLGVVLWQQHVMKRQSESLVARLESRLVAATAAAPPPLTADAFLGSMAGKAWGEQDAQVSELARRDPGEACRVIREAWPRMTDATARTSCLKWVAGTPCVIEVLLLGAADESPDVRARAFSGLSAHALQDFSGDPDGLASFQRTWQGKPAKDVLEASVRAWAARLPGLSDEEGVKALGGLPHPHCPLQLRHFEPFGIDVPSILREAGALEVAERWLDSEDERMHVVGAELLTLVQPDEQQARRVVLPRLASEEGADDELFARLADSLAQPGAAWAVDPLVSVLDRVGDRRWTRMMLVAKALGTIGDARATPALIRRLVVAENAGLSESEAREVRHAIGNYGLSKLTGVPYDASHDAAWWSEWWERNKARIVPESETLSMPAFAPRTAPSALHSAVRLVKGDEQAKYILHGPSVLPDGPIGVLIVLPGGDGSEDFTPFVRRIAENELPPGFVLAQLVAVRWTEDQQVVWPTRGLSVEGMRFSTEDFIASVLEDLRSVNAVDPSRTFVMGWSSGGPPAYSAALAKDVPVAGAFASMSVWKPDLLPPLDAAKGRAFWIDHGREDTMIPLAMPQQAEKDLDAAGARAHLELWPGGHGWNGDVYGRIRRGLDWLQRKPS